MIWSILTGLNLFWELHSHCNITDGELYNSPLAIKTRSMKIPPCPTKFNQLPYLVVPMGSRCLIPEVVRIKGSCTYLWLGSQRRVSSRFDGGQWGSLKFWHRVFLEDTITSRAAWNSGSVNDDLADLVLSYRIMMFHAPVNQRKPMGSTGIHVEPTGNECHKHHDITNPYKPFIIPIKLKPLKSIIQIDRYICLSININHILYILYPCTSPYMPNHIGEWMRPPYGKLPAQMDFSQAQPWQPWTKTRTLPIGASWSQPWGWWEVVPPWFWWTWNW